MKKIIFKSMMVALGVLLSVHAKADENGVLIGEVYYNLTTASKTATVVNGATQYTDAVTIPSSVIYEAETYDVTSIGSESFKGCTGLTSVNIGSNVTSIGDQAFQGCSGLLSVTIPDGVTSIGNDAFRSCTNLGSAIIGNGVKTIGDNAFNYCTKMTELTIGNNVTSIGGKAFYYCQKLTSVTIPSSVTSIGNSAFMDCHLLNKVEITDLAAWCKIEFKNQYSNPLHRAQHLYLNGGEVKDLVIPDGVTTIQGFAFEFDKGLRTVSIPNSVVWIGYHTFANCENLNTVSISGNGTTVYQEAFYNSNAITTVNITGSIASFGKYAFLPSFNSSLARVNITDLAAWCKVDFADDSANPLYYAQHLYLNGNEVKELTIPNGVTSIGKFAFTNCAGLTSVNTGSSVTSIGEKAFMTCENVASLTLGNSVQSVGEYAFSECYKLTSLSIPNNVTSLEKGVFANCEGLNSLNIGSGIQSLPISAFANCIALTTLAIPNNVTSIGASAFSGCTVLESLTIPSSITSMGGGAFSGCEALASVGITDLASWCQIAFGDVKANPLYYATNLKLNGEAVTKLVIPAGVTSISSNAFSYWKGLTTAIIGNDVTSIGEGAFRFCPNLSSATIGSSVQSIGQSAFNSCTGLQNLSIGNSVNSIGNQSFYNCSDLRSIVVVKGNTKYDSRNNCNALIETATNKLLLGCRNTIIPENVASIEQYAFYNCQGLTSISIPNSVTSIYYGSFSSCGNLKEVELHCAKVAQQLGGTGSSVCNVENIILGEELTSMVQGSFQNCQNMKTVVSYVQEPFAFNSSISFNNVHNTCKLIVPAGTKDAYIAKGWTEEVFRGGVEEMNPNSFAVADQNVSRGATVTIPIEMNNVDVIGAFQFEVVLPEGVTWSKCTLAKERKDDHVISAKKQADGSYQVTTVSMSDGTFSGTSGVVANIVLNVDENQIAGLYKVNISNIELTTEEGDAIHPLDVSATLVINDFMLGDTNGDGSVTITDAVMVISHILGNDPEGFVSNAADINDSGDITITDAVAIIKIVLNGNNASAKLRDFEEDVLDPQ